jgi:hypothetical protein
MSIADADARLRRRHPGFHLSLIRIDHAPGHDQAAGYRKGRKKEQQIATGRHEEALLSCLRNHPSVLDFVSDALTLERSNLAGSLPNSMSTASAFARLSARWRAASSLSQFIGIASRKCPSEPIM